MIANPRPTFRATWWQRRQQRILPAGWGKEVRTLLPVWLVTVSAPVALLLALKPDAGLFWAATVYALGCLVLGALPMGHEFNCRTMSLLLAQPIDRQRHWRRKLGALGLALLTAALAFAAGLFVLSLNLESTMDRFTSTFAFAANLTLRPRWPDQNLLLLIGIVVVPALSAFCAGPALTLVLRNPLAAGIFSMAIPLLCWMGVEMLGVAWFGGPEEADSGAALRVKQIWFGVSLTVYWVAGLVAGYRQFTRLQVIEDHPQALRLPRWFSRWRMAAVDRSSRPAKGNLTQLWRKELHLHQASFLVAGLFCLVWLLNVAVALVRSENDAALFAPLILIYGGAIALLVGAVTVAEERHLGTWAWQLTLPGSARRQWGVKLAVAFVLVLILGGGLPILLLSISPFAKLRQEFFDSESKVFLMFLLVVLPLTSAAIYASSVSSTSLRALVVGVGICVAFGLITAGVGFLVSHDGRFFAEVLRQAVLALDLAEELTRTLGEKVAMLGALFLSGVLLYLAFTNSRQTFPRASRIWVHGGLVMLVLVVIEFVCMSLGRR